MELSQLGFLEELLAPRKEPWNALSTGFTELLFPSAAAAAAGGWNFDPFVDNPATASSFASCSAFSTDQRFECPFTAEEAAATAPYPFSDDVFTMPDLDSSYPPPPPPPLLPQQEDEDAAFLCNDGKDLEEEEEGRKGFCKVEEQQGVMVVEEEVVPAVVFNMGLCGEKKPKTKKLEGQPSKNLMAERRRRKRLNDRLSMLRSIVPKISKMDRTSILGDTIDYMKELLERISKLQEEEAVVEEGTSQINLSGISKELKPNEAMVRNSPKFDVERREQDTRISICCATKPGLLLSTVNTLEALGLEIQQCVISSFNDFSMQASCSEVAEQRNCINPEEMKQALFRSAGYGGRCL